MCRECAGNCWECAGMWQGCAGMCRDVLGCARNVPGIAGMCRGCGGLCPECAGMCRVLPGCSCCPSRRGKSPWEKLLSRGFRVCAPASPQPFVLPQPFVRPHHSLPGRSWSQRQENPEPKPREEAEWSTQRALFSGACPQQVREQVAKHLMIWPRNEPPQLETPGDLHTPKGRDAPLPLLRINPPLGRSPGASSHAQTRWVHTDTFICWSFILPFLLSLQCYKRTPGGVVRGLLNTHRSLWQD